MPNHVHGILMIDRPNNNIDQLEKTLHGKKTLHGEKTLHATSLQNEQNERNEKMASISSKPYFISTIIRSYKSAVTKHAHRLGYEFAWQTRFYDNIIHNEKSFNQITEYISNNSKNWIEDKFHPNYKK